MQGSRAAASRRQPRDVPWWARLFFWVPVPEGIEARHWAVLGALGTSYLVNSYDTGVINLALPQVQQSFGLSEDAIGKLAALIRLGVLPALAAGLAADRIGRRRLLLATIVGFKKMRLRATSLVPCRHTSAPCSRNKALGYWSIYQADSGLRERL